MAYPTDNTNLVITGMGVPPYSARGLTQSLEPIAQATFFRRTVDGTAVDLSAPQFQKYQSTISGTDQQPPAFDGLWPGQIFTVDCIAELAYETSTGEAPERTVVASRDEGDWTFYRPRMTMMVTGFRAITDEYGAEVGWELSLEEV